MSDKDFSEGPSSIMLGKEFIIVLVIIFSGLSFTLGFFVGKSVIPKPEPVLRAVEPSAQIQKQEIPPAPPSPALAPAPEQTQAGAPVQQAVLPPVKEPASLPAPAAALPAQQQMTKGTGAAPAEVRQNSSQEKPGSLQQKSAESQIAKSGYEKSAQKIEPAVASESKSAVFTVQIGAFRNIADAKHLKAKFDKKGYKSFISAGKNSKAQKIFKVKTGEFTEKNDAEVLALKLKKTEGLQTYVTLKTE
jgi:cell division septation protein DedD